MTIETPQEIVVYGADWCGDTVRIKDHLEMKYISYEFKNIETDQDAEDTGQQIV